MTRLSLSSRVCRRAVLAVALVVLGALTPVSAEPAKSGAPEILLQQGHTNLLVDVVASPRGDLAATAAEDDTVRLWEMSSGRLRAVLLPPPQGTLATSPLAVAFSSDGRMVAVGGSDGCVTFWDAATGRLLKTWKGTAKPVRLAWQPHGRLLAILASDDRMHLLDSETLRARQISAPPSEGPSAGVVGAHVTCLAFSPDGSRVVAGVNRRNTKGACVWTVASDASPAWLSFPVDQASLDLTSVVFSPDGTMVAGGGRDGVIVTWDLASARVLANTRTGCAPALLAWARAGIVLGSDDTAKGSLLLLDPGTLAVRKALLPPSDARGVTAVARVGADDVILVGHRDCSATLWDLRTATCLQTFRGRSDAATSLALDRTGTWMAAGQRDGAVVLWNLALGRVALTLRGLPVSVSVIAFSPDSSLLVAADHTYGEVRAWKVADGTPAWSYKASPGVRTAYGAGFQAVAFNADGKHVAIGGGDGDGQVTLLDAASGQVIRQLRKRTGQAVCGLAFHPDGSVVTAADSSTVVELDALRIQPGVIRLQLAHGAISAVAFSPDGSLMAVTDIHGGIRLHGPRREDSPVVLAGRDQRILALAFSRDGRTLVGGDAYGGVLVWDVATHKLRATMTGHRGIVNAVAFMPGDGTLISSGGDSTIRLWDLARGAQVGMALVLDGGRNWVVTTPEGLFDASAEGQRIIQWRIGDALFDLEQFFNRNYRPRLLATLVLAQRREAPTTPGATSSPAGGIKAPPRVTIAAPQAGDVVSSARARVQVAWEDQGGGCDRVRLFVNGHRVPDSRRTVKGTSAQFEVDLLEGLNTVRATAFTADGMIESRGDQIRVTCTAKEATRPVLHVLAVGMGRYQAGLRLDCARADAEAVSRLFKPGLFAEVKIHTLLDEQATKAAVVKALRDLAAACAPQDALLVFLAGNGTMVGETWTFLPYDAVPDNEKTLMATGLAAPELAELLSGIPATKQLLVLDARYSGAATGVLGRAFASRDAVGAIRAQQEMARSSGVFMVAGSSVQQGSKGATKLEHSVLTMAILRALGVGSDKPAASTDRDGRVTVSGLLQYLSTEVPRLARQVEGSAQDIVQCTTGQDFPLLLTR